jgi:hypothetical protein
MRVLSSVPISGLGLIAVFGAGGTAQQSKHVRDVERVARPSEQLVLRPVRVSWNELVAVQASLAAMGPIEQPPMPTIDLPIQSIALPGRVLSNGAGHEAAVEGEQGGDIARITSPCTGFSTEPAMSYDADSQLDVPDGMGFSFRTPDAAAGVGPNHLMTMLNNKVLITDRLGGSPSSMDTSVFWSPSGATPSSPTNLDHRVYFDDLDGRWIASGRTGAFPSTVNTIMFAISDTDDPTGSWDFYSFAGTAGQSSDWVALGYNTKWITLTANTFSTPSGASFLGAKLWAIDKSTALSGGPLTVSIFAAGFMGGVHSGAGGNTLHPARTLDANGTQWILNYSFNDSASFENLIQVTRITGTGAAPVISGLAGSAYGASTSLVVATTTWSTTQRTMAQVTEPRFISAFSTRMASVAVRNGMIWEVNSGGRPGPSNNASPTSNGIIWHQLDPTLSFASMAVQSGAITDGTNTMSMYPAIAVNCADDVLIGFANGNSGINPRACYTMRLGTDALGFMGPINVLKAGEDIYWKSTVTTGTAPYGRYSSAAVDPNDDKTMWAIVEYADTRAAPWVSPPTLAGDADSRWGTHWARLGDCETLPVITDHPDDVTACVGDMVTFQVVATTGANPLSYQWRLDGNDILGANSDTYTIASAVPGDAGVYDCVVCGCGAVISDPATLDIPQPTVTTQPSSVFAALGAPASLSVAATGLGTLHYQWFRYATPVGTDSSTYSVAAVTSSDYGIYHCVVTDDCGPVTSDNANINPPLDFKKFKQGDLSFDIFVGPSSVVACIGGTAKFDVLAYPPGVTFKWRKDAVPIIPLETGSQLVVSPVGPGDAGSYDVVVSLGMLSDDSSDATMTVIDDPVITDHPDNHTVSSGTPVTLSVSATGYGLSYQWRHRPNSGGGPQVFSNIPGATSPTLFIEQVNSTNDGSYRCVVKNKCGSVSSNIATIILL